MRFPKASWLACVLVVMPFCVPPALAQTGTLQPAAKPSASEAAPKPPAAAPRTPVHQSGGGSTPHSGSAPVVQPHGPAHAVKPPAKPSTAHAPPAATALPLPPPLPEEDAIDVTPPADPGKPPPKSNVPRFAALRFDEVNMRVGPGPRYPIDWVYKRRDLPVEIEREFDIWRLIRDPDGTKGWVSQASLTGRRTFIVTAPEAPLRREAKDTAAAIAILKAGVIGRIRSCEAGAEWCQVQAQDYRGYLRRTQIWGTKPGEAVNP